jgi:hypothetical protein
MGAAEDPDIDDYYNKSREFPLTYSPEEDPEVVEEMRVAAVELKGGENDSEGEEDSNESDESGASGGSSSEDDRPEEGWEDVDDEPDGQSKRTKGTKLMSAIDKVC